jgi:hypothetical protein
MTFAGMTHRERQREMVGAGKSGGERNGLGRQSQEKGEENAIERELNEQRPRLPGRAHRRWQQHPGTCVPRDALP